MGLLALVVVIEVLIDSCVYQAVGGILIPAEIATAQTLAPNNFTSARWQQLYLGYFAFILIYRGKWRHVVHLYLHSVAGAKCDGADSFGYIN